MAISRMNNRHIYFLLSGKYSEDKIIESLLEKDNESNNYKRFFVSHEKNLKEFVENYELYTSAFDRQIIKFDIDCLIEKFLKEAEIDCSYEMLEDSKYADVGSEQIDMLIDSSRSLVADNDTIYASDEIVDAKLVRM